jgi:hypothetical protein
MYLWKEQFRSIELPILQELIDLLFQKNPQYLRNQQIQKIPQTRKIQSILKIQQILMNQSIRRIPQFQLILRIPQCLLNLMYQLNLKNQQCLRCQMNLLFLKIRQFQLILKIPQCLLNQQILRIQMNLQLSAKQCHQIYKSA